MMKIPMETKAMKWEDYYEQNSKSAFGLSKAVAEAVDESVVEAVETQVIEQHMFLDQCCSEVPCVYRSLAQCTIHSAGGGDKNSNKEHNGEKSCTEKAIWIRRRKHGATHGD